MKRWPTLDRLVSLRNWPWWVSASFLLCAVVLQLASLALAQKVHMLEHQVVMDPSPPVMSNQRETETDIAIALPDHASYTQDLAIFFKIANASSIELGAIDYRVEDNPKFPFLLNRTVEFRVNDEYPRIKAFLSRVLQKLPHASLQEIRIEKKDVLTAQGAIQIKLVLLYKVTPSSVGGANGQ